MKILGYATLAALIVLTTQIPEAQCWNNGTVINTEAFALIDDQSGDDPYLQFGSAIDETLTYEQTLSRFRFSDDVIVEGDLTANNQLVVNADLSGDATLTFGSAIESQTITLASGQVNFQVSTGAVFNGTLTASSAVLTNSANCTGLGTNVDGRIICNGTSTSSTLAPSIDDAETVLEPLASTTATVEGGNFDYDTAVSIPGWEGTIDAVRYLSDKLIEIDLTAGPTELAYDLVLSNGMKTSDGFLTDNGSGAIIVATSTWFDLRAGGDTFTDGPGPGNDIRYRPGMSLGRDAAGMYFSGNSPWSSWVKFESLGWTRGTNQTLEWVFSNPDGAMMIGIGSDATNESSSSQWAEAEVQAYFSGTTSFWGLYGNNGTPGSFGNQANGVSIAAGSTFKIKFEDDGDAGDRFTLYQLPSASSSDWDDESNVLSTFLIGGTLNPDETNIMPFIIPRSGGSQRFIAVRVQ